MAVDGSAVNLVGTCIGVLATRPKATRRMREGYPINKEEAGQKRLHFHTIFHTLPINYATVPCGFSSKDLFSFLGWQDSYFVTAAFPSCNRYIISFSSPKLTAV